MTCKWTEDESATWNTECGGAFDLSWGTPSENGMRFCSYCGKELVEEIYEDPEGSYEDPLEVE